MNRIVENDATRFALSVKCFVGLVLCLIVGCGELAEGGFRGALQKVGAKVVEGSSDETIRAMFESANDACPRRMDAFTVLEEVEMIDDTHAEFRYVVNETGKRMVTRCDRRTMKKAAVEHMRGNAMAVAIAERDLSVEHIYNDESGNHLLSYTINRAVLEGDMEPIGGERANPFDVSTVKTSADNRGSVLPQKLRGTRGSRDNPAGVQANPYFSDI